jgi:hypothetical protein
LKGLLLTGAQQKLVGLVEEMRRNAVEVARALGTLGGHLRNSGKAFRELASRFETLEDGIERLDRPDR